VTLSGGGAVRNLFSSDDVIPKRGALQPREGSPAHTAQLAGDPSLRLKNGYAQDDAGLLSGPDEGQTAPLPYFREP